MSSAQKMVTADQRHLYINLQPHFLTISEDLHSTYAFDAEGRLLSAFRQGVNYQRGLSGAILKKQVLPNRSKLCQRLSDAEAHNLIALVLAHVAQLRDLGLADQSKEVASWLERILAWNMGRYNDERIRFQSIYQPVSILPPDQYLSIVLQAAEGCSWNRCSFCTFYLDRRFRIKTPDEFQRHVHQVKAFLGTGISMRRSIFLGDANALIIPQARLRELIQIVHQEFTLNSHDALQGIYAFLDIFGAEQKSIDDYRELKDALVRRVYIGLETGDDAVFQLLNKPGSPAACVEAVQMIKAAGIHVGVILLAGAGGTRLANQHVIHSLATLEAMQLGVGDIVYLSPLVVPEQGTYASALAAAGSANLDTAALNAQIAHLKTEVRRVVGPGTRVTLYQIGEFMY
ncbi:radical SAM protein [Candidatus Oscillochloris fontis]|uniref:radical SAM protein n=1 Tax=Candidatus Oscillochloris fontis TaxID=2496868 RepID=UPI00101DA762|nr:radical SAM protein [Candidatus Oscillochloris fontis]